METAEIQGRPGKFTAIPAETIEKMQELRLNGTSVKEIAAAFPFSENTIRKYTNDLVQKPVPPVVVESEAGMNKTVEKQVLSTHAGNVLGYAKDYDSQVIGAGEAMKSFLEKKGIHIDITKMPKDELLKLVQSPGLRGDEMNADTKSLFDELLKEKIASLKTEKVGDLSIEKLLNYKLMLRMFADEGDNKGSDQINKLISENEKMRQEFRAELEKNHQEMKDLVMEKRLQVMDDTHAETVSSLSGQLNDLLVKIEGLKTTLPVGGLGAPKTALDELTDAVSSINRIKGSLTSLGVLPVVPGAPGIPVDYKNADGTTDYIRYGGDKLVEVSRTIADVISKRAPERKPVAETPPVSDRLTVDQAEQLYQQLLLKPSLTPVETGWVAGYLPIRAQYYPVLESSPSVYPVAVEHASLPSTDVPEVVPDPVDPVEHMGVLDRLQLEEEQRNKSLEGVL